MLKRWDHISDNRTVEQSQREYTFFNNYKKYCKQMGMTNNYSQAILPWKLVIAIPNACNADKG